MSMVFCRGCGKEIHSSAPMCPHCGATQANSVGDEKKSSWMAIVALILGVLTFLAGFAPVDDDGVLGGILFVVVSITLATIHLVQKRPGKAMPITAITLSVLGLLMLIGG